MGENSKIEWTDHTFNPWLGCQKVSRACEFCYAESWAKRTGSPDLWRGERRRTAEANWRKPLKWNAQAEAAGERQRVFCASLADVFEQYCDGQAETAQIEGMRMAMRLWRADLFRLIKATPWLDWLLLTKRPQNIPLMLPLDWGPNGYHNVWLGTTVESDDTKHRVDELLRNQAVVRFVSCEPLTSALDLRGYLGDVTDSIPAELQSARPAARGLQWVIAGGESGPNAQPSHPEWFRSLRDQCERAEVPYLFKQWGAWGLKPGPVDGKRWGVLQLNGAWHPGDGAMAVRGPILEQARMLRLGKKVTGRELDQATHDEFPEVEHE